MTGKRLLQRCEYRDGIVLLGYKPDDVQVLSMALDTLQERSKTAEKMIALISEGHKAKGKRVLRIMRGPLANTCTCANCRLAPIYNGFQGDTNVIVYTPEKTMMYDGREPWMVVPPEIGLAHELVHALHSVEGLYFINGNHLLTMFEEERTVGCGGFGSEEFSENAIRKDYGLPLRPKY